MESIIKYLVAHSDGAAAGGGIGRLAAARQRRLERGLAIGAISVSFVLACAAF
jgi:hypothetical protein